MINWNNRYSARPRKPAFIPFGQEGYDESDSRHGTRTGYRLKCKCAPCKRAQADAIKEYKHRKNPNMRYNAPLVHPNQEGYNPDDPRHGTLNGYQRHKCRCGPCTQANTDWSLEYYHRVNPDAEFVVDPEGRI